MKGLEGSRYNKKSSWKQKKNIYKEKTAFKFLKPTPRRRITIISVRNITMGKSRVWGNEHKQ